MVWQSYSALSLQSTTSTVREARSDSPYVPLSRLQETILTTSVVSLYISFAFTLKNQWNEEWAQDRRSSGGWWVKQSIMTFFHLHNGVNISKNLPESHAEKLFHAFVTSSLDYRNSPKDVLKLWWVSRWSNMLQPEFGWKLAGDIIHTSPNLTSLHWFPFKFRLDFKILILR